jgi:hypothetical protein
VVASTRRKSINPFYLLLMVAGTAFALTACAYGVMSVKMLNPAGVGSESESRQFFVRFMDEHGATIMLAEIAVLAVCTVLAMATDGYWQRGANKTGSEGEVSADRDASAPANREGEAPAEPGGW